MLLCFIRTIHDKNSRQPTIPLVLIIIGETNYVGPRTYIFCWVEAKTDRECFEQRHSTPEDVSSYQLEPI